MIILPGIDWYFGYEIAFPACMALGSTTIYRLLKNIALNQRIHFVAKNVYSQGSPEKKNQ